MKKEHVVPLCVALSALLLLFASSCGREVAGTHPGGSDSASNEAHAEAVLERYLNARERGQFKECTRFLTRGFLKMFGKTHDTDYADYFRNQNENNFLAPKVLDITERDEDTIVANVIVEVEGPGYKYHDAQEQYHIVWEGDSWKIDEWHIDYGEVDDWPYDD